LLVGPYKLGLTNGLHYWAQFLPSMYGWIHFTLLFENTVSKKKKESKRKWQWQKQPRECCCHDRWHSWPETQRSLKKSVRYWANPFLSNLSSLTVIFLSLSLYVFLSLWEIKIIWSWGWLLFLLSVLTVPELQGEPEEISKEKARLAAVEVQYMPPNIFVCIGIFFCVCK